MSHRKLMKRIITLFAVMIGVSFLASDVHSDEVEQQAIAVFTKRCHSCHGVEFKHEKLNVLDHGVLTAKPGDELEMPFVTPADLKRSKIWQVIEDDRMPPQEPLSDEEKAAIETWITNGATWPIDDSRAFISEEQVLRTIAQHLFATRKEDRRFQRYFTLHHLYNNRSVTDRELRIYRAAFSKAVNSMSDQSTIKVPQSIDDEQTIFNIDLRDYGWQEFAVWEQVVDEYPYGLKPVASIEARQLYDQIEELFGIDFDGIPAFRADWFVATATRPPLYHALMKTPEKLDKLLEQSFVDVQKNFDLGTARRAGLFESGVSGQNRLIEYHSSRTGRFWISYDFRQKAGRSNLARFPLGPKFEDNEFEAFAFEHAGGEIIYNLPNGLSGYMLVDGEDNRIDEGPVDIVWDALNVSGSPLIVNGLSCMSCHKHGILPVTDYVRTGNAVQSPEAREKILELFAEKAELDQAISDSRENYLTALGRAIAEPMELPAGDKAALLEVEEPISRVAMLYSRNLDLEMAARELGIEDPQTLKNLVLNGRVQRLGLGPLAIQTGTIKRSYWDSKESTSTVYQEAAKELNIGRPVAQIGN